MTTRRLTARPGMMVMGLILVACGGTPKDDTASGTSTTPAAAPAANSSKRNACAFVDRVEIEKMAGKVLNVVHDIQDESRTACEFTDPETKVTIFSATVLWSGGREQARLEQAAVDAARRLWQEQSDADMLELTGSDKVRGLADQAFYSDVMPAWILKGDVMVQTISPTWERQRTKKAFLMTARKALSMLGS